MLMVRRSWVAMVNPASRPDQIAIAAAHGQPVDARITMRHRTLSRVKNLPYWVQNAQVQNARAPSAHVLVDAVTVQIRIKVHVSPVRNAAVARAVVSHVQVRHVSVISAIA